MEKGIHGMGERENKIILIASLSRMPFGLEMARAVAHKLKNPTSEAAKKIRSRHGMYGVFYEHKEYCGHGLWFNEGFFELCEKDDGSLNVLQRWDSEESFVQFLARQSDYTCSGADPNEKVFFTSSTFLLNNQRLTRARFEKFLIYY